MSSVIKLVIFVHNPSWSDPSLLLFLSFLPSPLTVLQVSQIGASQTGLKDRLLLFISNSHWTHTWSYCMWLGHCLCHMWIICSTMRIVLYHIQGNDESIDAWCHSRIKLPWKFLHTYSQILNLTLLDILPSSWGITVLNNTLLNYLQFANHVAPSAIPLVVSPSWNDPDFSQLTPDLPVKIQHLKSPPRKPSKTVTQSPITVLTLCIYHSTHYLHSSVRVYFSEYEYLKGKVCLFSPVPKSAWCSTLTFNI